MFTLNWIFFSFRENILEWNRCIAIDIVQDLDPDLCSDPDWSEYWDLCLENTNLETSLHPDVDKRLLSIITEKLFKSISSARYC